MILQSTLSPSIPHTLSSPSSNSLFLPSGYSSFITLPTIKPQNHSITCSISKVRRYEKRPVLKWNNIYRKIALMQNREVGASSVLNECENEGKKFSKWELCRIVKELRKYKNFNRAIEVNEWMNNRIERFKLSTSDTAIQLDLIAKVRGVSSAEDYFLRLPDTLKDKRIYGALLNAYVEAKEREKAESLMEQLKDKQYADSPLPFNVMMTLYMKLNEYDQVEKLVSEMKENSIPLDSCSYNIWLASQGSRGSVEGMEQVFEQMKLEPTIVPNWTTFSTKAAFYIKLGLLEKAELCLKDLETRVTGADRKPYHDLISLYGSLGNKEEVYRVWNKYKSTFPTMLNWSYNYVIFALIRAGDIEGAEKMYEEWLQIKTSFDPKVANLLMAWYVKEEPFEKVKTFFDNMVEGGGKPNSGSWEILGEGYTKEGRLPEALSCFREAVLTHNLRTWNPKPSNVSAFLELCDQEANPTSKEEFVLLLTQLGCLQDETYRSIVARHCDIEVGEGEAPRVDESAETEGEESAVLFSITE